MPTPDVLLAFFLAAAQPVAPPAAAVQPDPATTPLPAQAGEALPDAAVQRVVLADSYHYFAARDAGRYEEAYGYIAPSMRAYLTPELYRQQIEPFNRGAGAVRQRLVTRMTWYRDPPDAPSPGLYVAADFVSRFEDLFLHCGYLMWHQEADGTWKLAREEQTFVDTRTAEQMAPENRGTLPRQMGCVQP